MSPKFQFTAKKISQLGHSVQVLHGIELFDAEDNLLLSAGFFYNAQAKVRDIILEEGERIIGIQSRIEQKYAQQAIHRDFQLILGKLV